MIFNLACRRYRRIESEAREIEITRADRAFVAAHALDCDSCRRRSEQLNAVCAILSQSLIEPTCSPGFTDNVIRSVRAMRRERAKHVWRPLVVGALSAAVALGAVLQIVGAQANPPSTDGTAQNSILRDAPFDATTPGSLNLFDSPSRLVRDPRPNDV